MSLAAIMAVIGILITPAVLTIMGAAPDTKALALSYANIYFYGLPFMFASYTIYTALRGVGDAPKAMYIMLMSTGMNAGLDPLFIFVFKMGVAGAALATVLSAVAAVGVGVALLASGRANITVPMWRTFRPRIGMMLQILGIGAPAGVNGLMRSTAQWFVTTLVASFGTVVVAAYGMSLRIMELGILFGVGLQLGAGAIVGQNLGARKKDRAREAVVKATLLVFALTGILGAIEFTFARQVLGLFTRDQQVVATGALLIRIFAIAQTMIAMHLVLSSAATCSLNPRTPTIIASVIEWGVQIPLILVAIHVLGASEVGVWWVMLLSACAEALLTFIWFRRGRWMHKEV
jgi:putative MATE family efflux protein